MAGMLFLPQTGFSGANDPAVPAGRNHGGYPVAIIGAGIDYTLGAVGQMLARDGEGEIIGYDLIDDDRRPFGSGAETDAAEILLAEGQAATLVVVRASVLQPPQLVRAIAYAARSPARIIAVFARASDPDVENVLAAAALQFPTHLFLASVAGGDLPPMPVTQERAANLMIVTNAADGAVPADSSRDQKAYADVAIDTSNLWDRSAALPGAKAGPQEIVLARTAALAARLLAVESGATAAELKARILALAEPLPTAKTGSARSGWIAQPRRHFWLE